MQTPPDMRQPARRATPWSEPIAILGMACRFPGRVSDPEELWRLLRDGRDAVEEVPSARWNADHFYDPSARLPGKMATRWGGFVHDVDRFDARFFRIAPREADSVDPQQRLLLELSWEAFESAALIPARQAGTQTGVFVGINFDDYQWVDNRAGNELGIRSIGTWSELDGYTGTGIARSIASGRISYTFGLEGPSLTIDTACSSSLVAVHQACQALRLGECDLALAGGATLLLTPTAYIDFSHMTGLAKDGRCKPFSAAADGLTWGDGGGLVVLKRLAEALADGDRVRAVIRGSAVNQDGRSRNLTAPSERAQRGVIERALDAAGVSADAISYVETHGTGTALGDPIEVRALGKTLGLAPSRSRALLVGSLKSNLGHTQAAAGVGSLIKTVLALENELIPASLHCQPLNPQIAWQELGVEVAAQAEAWPRTAAPRLAGVSSFGFSGTNAHVVIEEAPRRSDARRARAASVAVSPSAPPAACALFSISGHTPAARSEQAARLHQHLLANPQLRLDDLAHTLNRCRTHHRQRAAIVADTREALLPALHALARAEAHPACQLGEADTLGKVVFVFPGAGSQWLGMGLALLEQEPVFAAALTQADQALQAHTGWSVREVLEARGPDLERVDVVQPTLFALAIGLSALWRSWGVQPAAVVGHSQGEIAAACVSGALSLQDAARVVARRSQLLCSTVGHGGMAAVELCAREAAEWIARGSAELSIAAINTDRSTIVSGDSQALSALIAQLTQAGIFARRVKVDFASHSAQMDSLRPEIVSALTGLAPRPGAIPLYSTVRSQVLDGSSLDGTYWADNLRLPVRFADALQRLVNDGYRYFVEISPHPLLTTTMEPVVQSSTVQGVVVESLRRDQGGRQQLLASAGSLHVRGYALDWTCLSPDAGTPLSLPTYAFQRERFWRDREPLRLGAWRGASEQVASHPLLGQRFRMSAPAGVHYWERRLSSSELPFLADHWVRGCAVLPVAAIVEMALGAARDVFGSGPLVLEGLELIEPLVLGGKADTARATADTGAPVVQLSLAEQSAGCYRLQLCRWSEMDAAPDWVTHATGTVRRAMAAELMDQSDALEAVTARCREAMPAAELYERIEARGVTYGPAFRVIEQVQVGPSEVWATLRASSHAEAGYLLHPCLLDGAMHALMAAQPANEHTRGAAIVPVAIGKVVFRAQPTGALHSHGQLAPTEGDSGIVRASVRVVDESGNWSLCVHDLVLRIAEPADPLSDATLELAWRPLQPTAPAHGAGTWLVLDRGSELASDIARELAARPAQVLAARMSASGPTLEARLSEVFDRQPALAGIVYVASVAGDSARAPRAHRGEVGEAGLEPVPPSDGDWRSVLDLVHALQRTAPQHPPRLIVVTRQAQAVEATSRVCPDQALLWSMAGVVASEQPEWRVLRIDAPATQTEHELQLLVDVLLHDPAEDQLAVRGGGCWVPRLVTAKRPRGGSGAASVRADASYLVSGGLGALGLVVAGWLAARGATRLFLLGRDVSLSAERAAVVDRMRSAGVEVSLVRCDVADRAALAQLLDQIGNAGAPLRGIVHLAGVVGDGWLADQNSESFARVLAPKVQGAYNLHSLTSQLPLDFFVLYSSIAAVLGPPGLSSYAAANAYLDALAQLRCAQGLPASSINWGPFDGIGMAASAAHRAASTEQRGLQNLTLTEGEQLFARVLASQQPRWIVAKLDLPSWIAAAPQVASWPLLAELLAQTPSSSAAAVLLQNTELLQGLRTASPEQRLISLLDCVREQLCQVLRVSEAQLGDPRTPFMELGLESLMALSLRNRLEAVLGLRLPTTLIYARPNALALTKSLLERLDDAAFAGRAEAPSAAGGDERVDPDDIDALSDLELLRMAEELSAERTALDGR